MAVAHLGDGSHVKGVVQLAAAPHREPVDPLRRRVNFYRRRAVVSGEVVLVGETADVPGEPDGDGGHDRPYAEMLVVEVRDAATIPPRRCLSSGRKSGPAGVLDSALKHGSGQTEPPVMRRGRTVGFVRRIRPDRRLRALRRGPISLVLQCRSNTHIIQSEADVLCPHRAKAALPTWFPRSPNR